MKRNPFHFALIISILTILISGCTPSGGGSSDGNESDGTIPCLTEDWGDTEYWFKEANGNPVLIESDENAFYVAGVTNEGYIYVFVGAATDCFSGNLFTGAIDWNSNQDLDASEWLSSISGNVEIYDKTLTISNLVIEGTPEENIVAIYQGVDVYVTDNDVQIDSEILLRALLHGVKKIDPDQ